MGVTAVLTMICQFYLADNCKTRTGWKQNKTQELSLMADIMGTNVPTYVH